MLLWGVLVDGWIVLCLFYRIPKEEKRKLWLNVIKRKHCANVCLTTPQHKHKSVIGRQTNGIYIKKLNSKCIY